MNHIHIRLFGAFRQYGDGSAIRVALPPEATVSGLREAFARELEDENGRSLLRASAFATDDTVLNESDPIPVDREISILPPVCGG